MKKGNPQRLLRIFIFTIYTLCCASIVQANEAVMMKSPDGAFSAIIRTVTQSADLPPEFILEMRSVKRDSASKSDYTSKSGEHGLTFQHGAWTPDSRFFIFTTLSSGGHMAWQYPTFFFDGEDGKIHDFKDYLPPVAKGAFSLKPPDIITITIWTPLTTEKTLDDSIALPISFRMSDLKKH